MSILVWGSINIDHVYAVPHLPRPGETLAAQGHTRGLGGKGANQALAAAAAGARVAMIGAVGADGAWAVERLAAGGVDVGAVAVVPGATGHAVIAVDAAGENLILIHGGANRALDLAQFTTGGPGDWLLAQAETNGTPQAMAAARARGMSVAYAAAPFDAAEVAAVLPLVDLLAVNEGEAAALGPVAVPQLLVTLGAAGARYRGPGGGVEMPAFAVTPVDTTGAGDTFLGYFLAGLDAGQAPGAALRRAAAAAALQVTRPGAAEAIPQGAEVDAFAARHPEVQPGAAP